MRCTVARFRHQRGRRGCWVAYADLDALRILLVARQEITVARPAQAGRLRAELHERLVPNGYTLG
jgi:hypothetical protein